jgi:hypothetical protein
MSSNPAPKEDQWAFQLINTPFPPNPVKCPGQQNMYVALWYKHGKPIHGRAWNNAGVVECSFPYQNAELTGAKDLGGQIQVLQYDGDHRNLGYWYNWIPYKERDHDSEHRQPVKCGDSRPILWNDHPKGALLGYLDNKTEIAWFSRDGKTEQVTGAKLDSMLIIVRELKGGPPTCDCPECHKKPATVRVMLNEWTDLRAGDAFPQLTAIRALDRSLNTLPGEAKDQYVALWYQQGEPVMGRVWNDNGKVAACFSWGGHEYRKNIGSLQILSKLPDHISGFDYQWIPFPQAASFGNKEWHPVHVDNFKKDISPAVLIVDGKEVLGKVDVRNETASIGHAGSEKLLVGPAVHSCQVLCRKAKPGCKFD